MTLHLKLNFETSVYVDAIRHSLTGLLLCMCNNMYANIQSPGSESNSLLLRYIDIIL